MPPSLPFDAAPDVAAANNQSHLHAHPGDVLDLAGHVVHGLGIYAKAAVTLERLPAQLQKNAVVTLEQAFCLLLLSE